MKQVCAGRSRSLRELDRKTTRVAKTFAEDAPVEQTTASPVGASETIRMPMTLKFYGNSLETTGGGRQAMRKCVFLAVTVVSVALADVTLRIAPAFAQVAELPEGRYYCVVMCACRPRTGDPYVERVGRNYQLTNECGNVSIAKSTDIPIFSIPAWKTDVSYDSQRRRLHFGNATEWQLDDSLK